MRTARRSSSPDSAVAGELQLIGGVAEEGVAEEISRFGVQWGASGRSAWGAGCERFTNAHCRPTDGSDSFAAGAKFPP